MSTTATKQPAGPGYPTPADDMKDFIAVDDSGKFSFHRSEQDLIQAFEYADEARCIIDRKGSTFRLILDAETPFASVHRWVLSIFAGFARFGGTPSGSMCRSIRCCATTPSIGKSSWPGCSKSSNWKTGPARHPARGRLVLDGTETHPTNLGDIDRRSRTAARSTASLCRILSGTRTCRSGTSNTVSCPCPQGSICYVEIPASGNIMRASAKHAPSAPDRHGRTHWRSTTTGTFEVSADEEMYIRFRLTAPDGTVLAFSGRFPDKRAAAAGIAACDECRHGPDH